MCVRTASENIITSTATDLLPYSALPDEARRCHKFETISHPLLSVGEFCDAGLNVHFDSTAVYVTNTDRKLILQGTRDSRSRLYTVPLSKGNDNENQRVGGPVR